jgi:1-acyl-sn-glycerol-3-phosphate acyltransferase
MTLPDLFYRLVSLAAWLGIAVATVLDVFLIFLIGPVYLIDKTRRTGHWLASLWARAIVLLNPFWKVTVTGRENISSKQAYVMVSNHQSMGDIIVLYFLKAHFKWIAKESLFSVPVLGWGMSVVGYIRLTRGKVGSIRDSIHDARAWLTRGVSVLVFPEGTRSMTGELGAFKNGAFKLALQCKAPLLPIVVTGTRDAIPRGTWVFRKKVHAVVTILPPIFPQEDEDFAALKARTHASTSSELLRVRPAGGSRGRPGTIG